MNFDNESNVPVKAMMKSDQHQSEWFDVTVESAPQSTQCSEMEQWKATARFTVTLNSCAELDAISSETDFVNKNFLKYGLTVIMK